MCAKNKKYGTQDRLINRIECCKKELITLEVVHFIQNRSNYMDLVEFKYNVATFDNQVVTFQGGLWNGATPNYLCSS